MDELERHIRSIRDELDVHEPGPGLRERIWKDLPGKKVNDASGSGQTFIAGRLVRMRSLIWRAAVAVVVAGAAFAIVAGMLLRSGKLNDPQVAAVRETYRYYDGKVRELYQEAEPLLTANPDVSTELAVGMNELDGLSAQIIRDLGDNIASSEVAEALIVNYRLRIELLEDMLRIMKEDGNGKEKTKGNEL